METTPSRASLETRQAALLSALKAQGEPFDAALVIGRVNQYYLCGSMQDGLLALLPDGSCHYFVRRSYHRAKIESPLDSIQKIESYRDLKAFLPQGLKKVYLETEIMPLGVLDRLRRHFEISQVFGLDATLKRQRSVKDRQELALIEESGRRHAKLMRDILPGLLREGMSELDLCAELYPAMLRLGHHGVSRFGMFQMEMILGQVGFGESSIYPTCFDGPGGAMGIHPAAPILGSPDRHLRKGDLVFADLGFGLAGYHSDKTQIYCFGGEPSQLAQDAHRACRTVLSRAVSLLRPGAIASQVYQSAIAELPPALSQGFMGYRDPVKFLGHGLGLQIDEPPVLATGDNSALAEGMVLAIEPKCALPGEGLVGVEESYLLSPDGPHCITGGDAEIIRV